MFTKETTVRTTTTTPEQPEAKNQTSAKVETAGYMQAGCGQATAPTPPTSIDFHYQEKNSATTARLWFDQFLAFPNGASFDMLCMQLRIYQTDWMMGRKRVLD